MGSPSADNNKEWSFVRDSGKMEGQMTKPVSTPWNSLIWTESPLKDSFRLADLSQRPADKAKKIAGKETAPSSEAPRAETQPKDSFEIVDASRRLYIKSLLG